MICYKNKQSSGTQYNIVLIDDNDNYVRTHHVITFNITSCCV